MLVCAEPTLEAWEPDFSSSGQANPRWTRVLCGERQVTNSLEGVEWQSSDPAVQLEICESCGFAHCASGGYAHVSHLGGQVLFTAPHIDPADPFERFQYRAAAVVGAHGAVVIPMAVWNDWHRRLRLPPPTAFPRTTRRDLFDAWRSGIPFGEALSPEEIVTAARRQAVASDPRSLDDALDDAEFVARWFAAALDAPVEGQLVAAPTESTLYLDVPDTFDRNHLHEWRPTARLGDDVAPAFAPGLVLRLA